MKLYCDCFSLCLKNVLFLSTASQTAGVLPLSCSELLALTLLRSSRGNLGFRFLCNILSRNSGAVLVSNPPLLFSFLESNGGNSCESEDDTGSEEEDDSEEEGGEEDKEESEDEELEGKGC